MSDTSNGKENINTRDGITKNDGNYHPPMPYSHDFSLATRTTTLPITKTTKDTESEQAYEDWTIKNKNRNSYKKKHLPIYALLLTCD